MSSNPNETFYDYIFAGFGASASLLLLEMDRRNLLNNSKVLIIDPDPKKKNDKTFCFWAEQEEAIIADLHPLISHSWSEAVTGNQIISELNPYQYHHIQSIELYRRAQDILTKNGCSHLNSAVDQIRKDDKGSFICAAGKILRAGRIFDSRPPDYEKPSEKEVHIHQSFIGWVVETENPVIEESIIHLMDFEVEQDGGTQFVYFLPFSKDTALVEITRFGSDIIHEEAAQKHLESYLQKNFGNFTIKSVEKGCIPMSNAKILGEELPGISLLGSRNYAVKPSTGYAFKNMYRQAGAIANCLETSDEKGLDALNNSHVKSNRGRFAFYDALLLMILKYHPEYGKPIFKKLFSNTRFHHILQFLDEKSNLWEELIMFSRLPLKPFMQALFRRTVAESWLRPVIITLITLILITLGFQSKVQTVSGYALLLCGMFLVGIPHGAVDHLLESGMWDQKKRIGFITQYLLQAAAMAAIWFVAPNPALLFFLVFSAWHFGQADGNLWDLPSVASTLWGASILFYILGTHQYETNLILSSLSYLNLPFECPVTALLPWLFYAFLKRNIHFGLTILWLSLSSMLPLMLAFGLYFIGQHSFTSWTQICRHLNMRDEKVWLHALPFHLGGWLLMAAFLLLWPVHDSDVTMNRWAVFFIFIACISLPHTISMKVVYTKKS